jgi:hypothetical protein
MDKEAGEGRLEPTHSPNVPIVDFPSTSPVREGLPD